MQEEKWIPRAFRGMDMPKKRRKGNTWLEDKIIRNKTLSYMERMRNNRPIKLAEGVEEQLDEMFPIGDEPENLNYALVRHVGKSNLTKKEIDKFLEK